MKPPLRSMYPYSKLLTLGTVFAVLFFAIGLLIYVYFQGGVDKAVYLTGQG